METGILMRYGFDGPRKGNWKAKELEQAITEVFGCKYAQLTSSGTSALTTAMAALALVLVMRSSCLLLLLLQVLKRC